MKTYTSKNSVGVNIITVGVLISMAILIFSLFTFNEQHGIVTGIIISALILGVLFYFYSNSLNKIVVGEKSVIFRKPFGKIEVSFTDIINIEKLAFSNLSMTYGSKGVFGYTGNTMDNSVSLVNNRQKMVRISTKEEKYTISADKASDFITDLKNVTQNRS